MSTDKPSDADNLRFTEFLADYFVECDEHLALARHCLLELERSLQQSRVDPALVDELFRSFHSLKGLSAMVGYHAAEQLGHHLESYLGVIRRKQTPLERPGLEALISGVALMEQAIAAHRDSAAPPDVAPLLRQLEALLPAKLEQPTETQGTARRSTPTDEKQRLIAEKLSAGRHAWEIRFSPSAELAAQGIDVSSVRKRLLAFGEIVQSAPLIDDQGRIDFSFVLLTDAKAESVQQEFGTAGIVCQPYVLPERAQLTDPPKPAKSVEETASTHLTPANVVRVDLDRLDDLMRLVGELVLSRARLDEGLQHLKTVPATQLRALRETASAIERQLRDLREGVMRVRMVPIREVFVRMQFVIRDLVREAGKQVALVLSGEETQIDKFVVERIMDPLLHLVRNAVSHGAETPADRAAIGKPPQATISLRARTSGEMVVIEVEDDGAGIDIDRLISIARAKGIELPSTDLDASMILDVLCIPGFSTRERVDRVSGRGIGMDVVRRTVEELGGSLFLQTTPGKGSQFEIHLPLTVAITEALIVQVGQQRYAVPQVAIREIVRVECEMVIRMERNELIRYRDGALPLLRLATLFGATSTVGDHFLMLVIGEGSQGVGIAIDRVLGLQEIVVRPLTDSLVQVPGITGATELGDGRVVLILDAAGLVRGSRKGRHLAPTITNTQSPPMGTDYGH
jgi:two-component system chemotaxis sensor kinase CheA